MDADVVVNHFGWPGTYDTVNYSSYDPFNDSSYFHPFCQVVPDDYINNQTAVENVGTRLNRMEQTKTNSRDKSAGWAALRLNFRI